MTHGGGTRRSVIALAGAVILMLSASACTSNAPESGPTSAISNGPTDGETRSDLAVEGKSPEEIAQEILDSVEIRDLQTVVAGKLKSGPNKFGAELAILAVEASESSTRLVIALRSTTGEEESLDRAALNVRTPLNPGIRDVSVTDPTAERVLMPFLAYGQGKDPLTESFCLCSDSPKTLNETWYPVYATLPALDPETSSVTVTIPGFDPVPDVSVTRK